jgi:hypothetical protein
MLHKEEFSDLYRSRRWDEKDKKFIAARYSSKYVVHTDRCCLDTEIQKATMNCECGQCA